MNDQERKILQDEAELTMSDTIVDMPKVAQMLDAGWIVQLERGGMCGYVARGRHTNYALWSRSVEKIRQQCIREGNSPEFASEVIKIDFDTPGEMDTDDFTPEQALTRLAYKVQGELL
jgi:hypothetical protein